MKLKLAAAGLLCGVCLAACAAHRQTLSAPQELTAPQAHASTQEPTTPQVQDSTQKLTAPQAPAAVSPSAAPSQAVSQPSSAKTQTVSAVNAAPAPQGPTPQELVQAAREGQTLHVPPADEASFEGEDLIPLDGRRLSPMAYEPVSSQPTSAPWSGEELKYGIYYSFIKAGTAYIKNRGLTTVNGRPAYLLQTTAFSATVIDAFFKVRDVNYSWLDAETFYSLGYLQSVREGGYKRDEWLIFDYPRQLFYGEIQKKEEPRIISGELPMKVLDMLSSLYFVRAQKLEPGQDIVFDIINREHQYPLIVKVLGKETIKTDA